MGGGANNCSNHLETRAIDIGRGAKFERVDTTSAKPAQRRIARAVLNVRPVWYEWLVPKPKRLDRTVYGCTGCGHVEVKWVGRCPACQAWSTMVEHVEAAPGSRAAGRATPQLGLGDGSAPSPITEVGEILASDRLSTQIGELDRVLGGGLVAGTFVLLGGDPGVGKSTLLIQALAGLTGMKPPAEPGARDVRVGPRSGGGSGRIAGKVLYATGEESDRKSVV